MSKDPLIRGFLKQAGLLPAPGAPLVAAVSGGADSVALVRLLLESGLAEPENVLVAHFDHALRPDAAAEAERVAAWAEAWGTPFKSERWSEPQKRHDPAREARYAFLLTAAQQFGAACVVTGHHRDDQAETVLERLFRGSGTKGLAAMAPVRPLEEGVFLSRPLLGFSRESLRDWLAAREIPWLEDPGNRDRRYLRSRLRHDLMPALETWVRNPAVHLAETAHRLGRADAALEWALGQAWEGLNPRRDKEAFRLDRAALAVLPEELAVRALFRVHGLLNLDGKPPGGRAAEGFLKLRGDRRRRWRMRVKGLSVRREGADVVFTPHSGGNGRH